MIGEASDWAATTVLAPASRTEMVLVDWELIPGDARAALDDVRKVCPPNVAIVLTSRLDARPQAALSSGADAFVSKMETANRVAGHLRIVAENRRDRAMPPAVFLADYTPAREPEQKGHIEVLHQEPTDAYRS